MKNNTKESNRDSVSASEIGEYVYCKRAWWLQSNYSGVVSTDKLEGSIRHDTLFDQISKNKKLTLLAIGLLITGAILVIASLILEIVW